MGTKRWSRIVVFVVLMNFGYAGFSPVSSKPRNNPYFPNFPPICEKSPCQIPSPYEESPASFRITEPSLEELAENVPKDVLGKIKNKIQGDEDGEFCGKEAFLAFLIDTIGEEQADRYKSLFLKHTKLPYEIPPAYEIPHEVDKGFLRCLPLRTPYGLTQAQRLLDIFSWQSFLALNWPVDENGTPKVGINSDDKYKWLQWMSWKESSEVYKADGTEPAAWDEKSQRAWFDLSSYQKSLPSAKFNEVNQAFAGPLWDQNGNMVHYMILMNRLSFGFIANQGLFNLNGQIDAYKVNNESTKKLVWFPTGNFDQPDDSNSLGAMELKLAWKKIDESQGDIPSRYFTLIAPNGTWGLVGMHIAHKTLSAGQWVWSTFEHVDNVRVDHSAAGQTDKPLFSVASALSTSLDNGDLSPDLRQAFSDHHIALFETGNLVWVRHSGSEWQVTAPYRYVGKLEAAQNGSFSVEVYKCCVADTKPLFSLEPSPFVDYLDGNPDAAMYRDAFRERFEKHGLFSNDFSILIKKKGIEWTIDGQAHFIIKHEDEQLNVYRASRLKPAFYDPNCETCPVNVPPDPDLHGVKKTQVMRVVPIANVTEMLNRQVRKQLRDKGSVWQYYELIGTQWPTDDKASPTPPGHAPASVANESGGKPTPVYLANSVLETYFQEGNQPASNFSNSQLDSAMVFGTSSCMGCHYAAAVTIGYTLGQAGYRTPVFGPPDSANFSWLLQTRARWQTLLFGIGARPSDEQQLNGGKLPEALRDAFHYNGYDLPPKKDEDNRVAVCKVKKIDKWIIAIDPQAAIFKCNGKKGSAKEFDSRQKYTVRKEEGRLNVYLLKP